jgi:hypothetical protein
MSYGDYVEQLTYLLFLKMADERTKPPLQRLDGGFLQPAYPGDTKNALNRDKASLDIFWVREESARRIQLRLRSRRFKRFNTFKPFKSLKAFRAQKMVPIPIRTQEIVEDLEGAPEQCREMAVDLAQNT